MAHPPLSAHHELRFSHIDTCAEVEGRDRDDGPVFLSITLEDEDAEHRFYIEVAMGRREREQVFNVQLNLSVADVRKLVNFLQYGLLQTELPPYTSIRETTIIDQ